nr:MAG TPA: hypothetical protein [Caudoviricetes sp.]
MKKYIHNRKFVIAEFNLEQLQEAEDFLNNEYPNYALVHVHYYYNGQANRVRYVLQRENSLDE